MERYDAFISYSHAADGQLAPAIQQGLHRLARRTFQRRALRVFRDQSGLSTNPHLWDSIAAALAASERFVLLASPEAAASTWVDREVSTWLADKPMDRLLVVVTDGELAFDSTGAVDPQVTTCLPPSLAAAFQREPRWLDLRWAREDAQLDLRNGRFRAAIANLAAPMHGLAKDELESDDVRQQRRTRRLATTALGTLTALTVLAGITTITAVQQRDQARRATNVAVARGLAARSSELAGSDIDLSLLLAVEGFRRLDHVDTRAALLKALDASRSMDRVVELPRDILDMVGRPATGELWVLTNSGTVRAFDLDHFEPVGEPLVTGVESPSGLAISDDGRYLAYSDIDSTEVLELETRYTVASVAASGTSVEFDPAAGQLLINAVNPPSLFLVDLSNPDQVFEAGITDERAQWPSGTFDAHGDVIASLDGANLVHLDKALKPTGAEARALDGGIRGLARSPDGRRVHVQLGDFRTHRTLDPTDLHDIGLPTVVTGSRADFEIDPAGDRYALTSDDGTTVVYAEDTGEQLGAFGGLDGWTMAAFVGGDRVLSSAQTDGTAVLWHLGASAGVGTVEEAGGPTVALESLDDGRLLSVTQPGTYVLTLPDGTERTSSLPEGTIAAASLAVDAAHARFATTTFLPGDDPAQPPQIRIDLRRLDDLELIRSIPVGYEHRPSSISFDPAGERLAIGTATGSLLVLNAADGQPLFGPMRVEESGWVLPALLWAPDGSHLLAGGQDGVLRRFRTDTWDIEGERSLSPGAALASVAMAPDGRYAVLASESGQVFRIDPGSGEDVAPPLLAGGTQIQRARVTDDGSIIAAISRDGALRLWDAATGAAVGPPLTGHEGLTLALAALGGKLVTGGIEDGQRITWNLDPAAWTAEACRRAGRDLTDAEWATYVGSGARRAVCHGEESAHG